MTRNGLPALEHRAPTDASRNVLIVEDEPSIRDALADLFDVPGTSTVRAATVAEAQRALGAQHFDFIITDVRLASRVDGGLQVIGVAGMLSPDAPIIALTAFPDDDVRLASLRLGATEFFAKPVDLATIADVAARYHIGSALHPSPIPLATADG